MKCSLTSEMIKRFYSNSNDRILEAHLSLCKECRETINMISALNLVKFSQKPSLYVDEKIIAYAYKKIKTNFYYYIKELTLSFSLALAVFLFVFIPTKRSYQWHDVDTKISEFESEINSVDNIFYYSDYLWDLNSEVNI